MADEVKVEELVHFRCRRCAMEWWAPMDKYDEVCGCPSCLEPDIVVD